MASTHATTNAFYKDLQKGARVFFFSEIASPRPVQRLRSDVSNLFISLDLTFSLEYAPTVQATRDALKANGFGIITEIDFQATFKQKLDADILPSIQLGACNPTLAYKVYSADPSIATMLPCHVLVQAQENGSTRVTFADPLKVTLQL